MLSTISVQSMVSFVNVILLIWLLADGSIIAEVWDYRHLSMKWCIVRSGGCDDFFFLQATNSVQADPNGIINHIGRCIIALLGKIQESYYLWMIKNIKIYSKLFHVWNQSCIVVVKHHTPDTITARVASCNHIFYDAPLLFWIAGSSDFRSNADCKWFYIS